MMNKQNKADLQVSWVGLHVLAALFGAELHGYAIRQAIEQDTDGRLSPSVASLYENIARLLDEGLIERAGEQTARNGRVRKYYRITGVGQKVLEAKLMGLERLRARSASVGALA
jgi:DNA-binding PadR family transcriptional regulator